MCAPFFSTFTQLLLNRTLRLQRRAV